MAAKKQQTHAKRARELAVKERRERKQAKKAEAAARRAAGELPAVDDGSAAPEAEEPAESTTAEWVR
jgi:hypothetical protein